MLNSRSTELTRGSVLNDLPTRLASICRRRRGGRMGESETAERSGRIDFARNRPPPGGIVLSLLESRWPPIDILDIDALLHMSVECLQLPQQNSAIRPRVDGTPSGIQQYKDLRGFSANALRILPPRTRSASHNVSASVESVSTFSITSSRPRATAGKNSSGASLASSLVAFGFIFLFCHVRNTSTARGQCLSLKSYPERIGAQIHATATSVLNNPITDSAKALS